MNKIAQRRGIWQKLKEKANLHGRAAELISEEFAKFMEELREVDDEAREEASTLKEALAEANSKFKSREYVSFYVPLSIYYETNKRIADKLFSLVKDLNSDHYKFLSETLSDDEKTYLKELSEKFPKSASRMGENLLKTAGFYDWFSSLFSKRKSGLYALEKRFPKVFKGLKVDGEKLLGKAYKLFANMKSNFKLMGAARAGRSIEEYLIAAQDFVGKFKEFEKAFMSYYNGFIKPAMDLISKPTPADEKLLEQKDVLKEKTKEEIGKLEENKQKLQELHKEIPLEEGDISTTYTLNEPSSKIMPAIEQLSPVKNFPKYNLDYKGYPVKVKKEPAKKTPTKKEAPKEVLKETLKEEPKKTEDVPAGFTKKPMPAPKMPESSINFEELGKELSKKKESHNNFLRSLTTMAQTKSPADLIKYIVSYSEEIENIDPESSSKLLLVARKILQG